MCARVGGSTKLLSKAIRVSLKVNLSIVLILKIKRKDKKITTKIWHRSVNKTANLFRD
jgi:hypothetical protein